MNLVKNNEYAVHLSFLSCPKKQQENTVYEHL